MTKKECLEALNEIECCYWEEDKSIGARHIFANSKDIIRDLINEHFDNQFLDAEVEILISLLRPIEEELGMDITLLIDKLRRIQNTLPKEKGVVEIVEFEID